MLRTKDKLNYDNRKGDPQKTNPCYLINSSPNKPLSDRAYLESMIPHHQVAINVSKKIMRHTVDPNILYFARHFAYTYENEILLMEGLLLSGIPSSASQDAYKVQVLRTEFAEFNPETTKADSYQCNFYNFSPNAAVDSTSNIGGAGNNINNAKGGRPLVGTILHKNNDRVMSECEYINFMINHLNIELVMSNKIVRQSRNTGLVSFAYDNIRNRKYDIWRLNNHSYSNSQSQCSDLMKYGDKLNF